MAKLGEANIGGRLVPAWLLDLTAEELDGLKWHSNTNLLDNWYFGNPVNQRGQTSYTDIGYGIDRWKSLYSAPTILVYADGIALKGVGGANGWGQIIDKNIFGRTCTLSVLIDATLYSHTVTIPASDYFELINQSIGNGWFYGIYRNTSDTEDAVLVRFFAVGSLGISPKIKAVKLELGTQQTLAYQDEDGNWQLFETPYYAEELAKCQPYQVYIPEVIVPNAVITPNIVYFDIPVPAELYKNPILSPEPIIVDSFNTPQTGFVFSCEKVKNMNYMRVRATKISHNLTGASLALTGVLVDANL